MKRPFSSSTDIAKTNSENAQPESSSKTLSAAQRKAMLVERAAAERETLLQAAQELSHKFSHFHWLKIFAPRWLKNKNQLTEPNTLIKLAEHYSLIKPLIALALSRPVRRTTLKLMHPVRAARFGAVGLIGWSAWKIWCTVKSQQEKKPTLASRVRK